MTLDRIRPHVRERSGWLGALLRLLGQAGARGRGKVTIVGAGPGSADLLTIRALRALQDADVVLHDALVGPEVLALVPAETEQVFVGKRKGAHAMGQRDIEQAMIRHARAGRRVVRLKAGDPLVLGRAGEEMAALDAAGIPYEIVPGVTAALAAAADARLPLTLRGITSTLVFASAHAADDRSTAEWPALAAAGATVAIYMGRSAGAGLRDQMLAQGLAGATPVVAVENAGRPERRILSGTIDDLPALSERTDVTGPTLVIVGMAAGHADARLAEAIVALAQAA